MNALTLIISTALQELRQSLTKLFVQDGGSILILNAERRAKI